MQVRLPTLPPLRRNGKCPFYCAANVWDPRTDTLTERPCRCVLLSPEEWRLRRGNLEWFCRENPRGCPVYRHLMSLLST